MNEAVEQAHRAGVLTSASLMVAGAAAEDAVRRARALPTLRVGLHLVAVEGPTMLSARDIPLLAAGHPATLPSDQLGLALRYALRPAARRQLAAEIRAQFAAFAATGLPLDHADAHKHMHLHPVVGRLIIEIGRDYGLRAVRVPAEPPAVLAACGESPPLAARAMHAWTALLRSQARRAGLVTNEHAFGLAWSGHMTPDRLLRLLPHLPDGLSEIYFHPATRRDSVLTALMPDYEHEAELAALLDSRVAEALASQGASITDFSEEVSRWSR